VKPGCAIAFVVAVTTAATLASPSAQAVDTDFVPCGRPQGIRCAWVPVPLDRSGALAGEIELYVERRASALAPGHGALFVLAGGPGEAATAATERFAAALAPALRRRDLVVFDQRGTGRSGFLDCPNAAALGERLGERCAAEIGPAVHRYTTRDSVDDLEAVRRRVGVDRIALFGLSYGTRVAQAYANMYPQHVERLILDSVVPVDGYDFFERSSYAAIAPVLTNFCRRNPCRRLAPDLVRDVAWLADKAHAGTLAVPIVTSAGAVTTRSIAPYELAQVLISGFSFDPIERARLPAAVHSALAGDGAPLGRLVVASRGPEGRRAKRTDTYNPVVNRATLCEEITPPWPRTATNDERVYLGRNALAAIPESAFYPLNRDATDAGLRSACGRWPISASAPSTSGIPPDVPVLLLEGALDTLTPLADAEKAASRFPHAQVLTVPDAGHAVAFSARSRNCVQPALARFLAGRLIRTCTPPRPAVSTSCVAPTDVATLHPWPGVPGQAGKLLRAVIETIDDVELTSRSIGPPTGLRGGTFEVNGATLQLKNVVYVPDVAVRGKYGVRSRTADLRVTGPGEPGRVFFRASGRIRGTLAGRPLPKTVRLGKRISACL
jgi:pimeloyl-ACP methyl ester carboxylesterase